MSTLIKQQLTPERIANIKLSVMVMAVMARVIEMEYYHDMDVDFRTPMVNNFAARIVGDCKRIAYHLKNNDKANIEFVNPDTVDEYAAALLRVVKFFIRLPHDQINDVMDSLVAEVGVMG